MRTIPLFAVLVLAGWFSPVVLAQVEISTSTGVTPVSSKGISLGRSVAVNHEAVVSNPALAARLIGELGLKVVNLSPDDLRVGPKALREYLARSPVPYVSANVYEAATGKRATRSHVILEWDGKKVGVTGVAGSLWKENGEWDVRDAASNLKKVVSDLRKEADVIILLAWMSRSSAAELLRAFPPISLCFHTGRGVADVDPVIIDGRPLLQGATGPGYASRTRFSWDAGGGVGKLEHSFESGPVAVSEKVRGLYAECGLLPPDWKKIRDGAGTAGPQIKPTLSPGEVLWISRERENRAVRLRLHSVALQDSFGEAKAKPGSRFVVLDIEWENIVPPVLVHGEKIPPSYTVPSLRNHTCLVVNGSLALRIHEGAGKIAGHLSPEKLFLSRQGSVRRGFLVFETPSDGMDSLELRYYDYGHGNLRVPILTAGKSRPVPMASGKNAFVEVAVGRPRMVSGPAGMERVLVDLTARCRFTLAMKVGTRSIRAGAIAEWRDAHKSITLLVDGRYAHVPAEESTLPRLPRLLPDIMTGGTVAFLVPRKRSSLELVLDFPEVVPPGGAAMVPRQIRFSLEGTPPRPEKGPPLSVFDDGPLLRVSIRGKRFADRFAGRRPGAESRFLVVDITLGNRSERIVFVRPGKRFRYLGAEGNTVMPHPVTKKGERHPPELLSIPAGEERSFQLVFETSRSETRTRLSYGGVDGGRIIELSPGAKIPPCPGCGKTPDSEDHFCQQCGKKLGP